MLLEFTQLKNTRDDLRLVDLSHKLIDYVENLLANHFAEEDRELFPLYADANPHLIQRLISDHREIESKTQTVKNTLQEFQSLKNQYQIQNYDWQKLLLYPAYNLIATINHHAMREDKELFSYKWQAI
jgi:hemerythrin-like domain-containing protein